MRIVMIGHSNVGKTTYMASMYGAMQDGIGGFTLRAVEDSDHKRFLSLHKSTRTGRYPAPTDQRSEYQFRLCHHGKAFFTFTWVDRRGGAILNRADSPEATALVNDLTTCDGLLVFCDSAAAERGDEDANEMSRISVLVSRAVGQRSRPMPVGIVFTKSDLVDTSNDRVVQRLLSPVEPLIECVAASKTMIGCLLPVSCGPNEQNVAVPVLFALFHGIVIWGNALHEEVQQRVAEAEEHNARANEWLGIADWWRGVTGKRTYAERRDTALAEAQRKFDALKPLFEPAEALGGLLESLQRF